MTSDTLHYRTGPITRLLSSGGTWSDVPLVRRSSRIRLASVHHVGVGPTRALGEARSFQASSLFDPRWPSWRETWVASLWMVTLAYERVRSPPYSCRTGVQPSQIPYPPLAGPRHYVADPIHSCRINQKAGSGTCRQSPVPLNGHVWSGSGSRP